ncbi:GntR family transcriptional regulator [Microterricola gilva]|uniref:GntR family transcriptional regulator n=1 Tax=Microterricola gilva TaxID=393267 RepID=A0A4Q8AK05_9MICO|nr:GntR family transcriptional regulator [Microterricola gilva]RZU64830.1 GntR family transcriptional regulator [Microterricola gilva]
MVDSPSAAERVHTAIRAGIMSGFYAPGSMLSEAELAAAHGVSRTPVRAALSRLQEEEWVTVYPKRGVLVRELSAQEAYDFADARHLLESSCVQRTRPAERGLLADRLSALLDAQERALAPRELPELIELMLAFHRGFVEAAGNETLLELYDRLNARHAMMMIQRQDAFFARSDAVMAEHRSLIAELRAGDWAAFTATLRTHMIDAESLQPGIG